jgi:hypothetical protein
MRLGITSKLYFNSSTYDAPAWLELNLISDLNVTSNWDEDESSTRASRAKTLEPTIMALELSGKVRKEILNTPFLMMRAAFNTAGVLDVMVLDGAIGTTGSDGFRFVAKVFAFAEDQSLGKVIFKEFTLKPCVYLDGNGDQVSPKTALVTAPDSVAFGAIG